MSKVSILVADPIADEGLAILRAESDVEVQVRPGLSVPELAQQVGEFDGLIIRSGVKVTAEVLARHGKLKAIARAGVGIDNVDVDAATRRGIIVMNTPDGNTLSTAELTITLMLALSRNVVEACNSLRSGRWDRKKYLGSQLAGKTLGVVGMGRVGRAVALRAKAFEMKVLALDPFLTPESAAHEDIELCTDLMEVCSNADYITVHTPLSDQTRGLIGAEQIAAMKTGVRLINCARGGIIDESALCDGIKSGRVAGAALDVFETEPPKDSELLSMPNVVVTPHLGASTREAQLQVACDAARQLLEALRGRTVRGAVNVPGFAQSLPDELKPYIELAKRMGALAAGISSGNFLSVRVIYRGEIAEMNTTPVTTSLLVALLQPHFTEPLNVVNAPVLAQERGINIDEVKNTAKRDFSTLIRIEVNTAPQGGTASAMRSVTGTIFGRKFPRIIAIDNYRMEMIPEGHVAVMFNSDEPGVIGKVGGVFGNHGINIGSMTFGRDRKTNTAVLAINLDGMPPDGAIEELNRFSFMSSVHVFHLPELFAHRFD